MKIQKSVSEGYKAQSIATPGPSSIAYNLSLCDADGCCGVVKADGHESQRLSNKMTFSVVCYY